MALKGNCFHGDKVYQWLLVMMTGWNLYVQELYVFGYQLVEEPCCLLLPAGLPRSIWLAPVGYKMVDYMDFPWSNKAELCSSALIMTLLPQGSSADGG